MKLNANNFSGINSEGNRYRIKMEKNEDKDFPGRQVLTIKNLVYWPHCDKWFTDGIIACEVYTDSKTYLEALEKALTQIEEQTGLELIKRKSMKLLKTA